jgi:hypothetical protein
MNAKLVLSPAVVLEIVRDYVIANYVTVATDCDVKESTALVSCERDELPVFDGISVSVTLKVKKK